MTRDQTHADDESLSVHLDGESTSWATHVADCGDCTVRLGELARVRDAVSKPTRPAPSAVREQAVAAAMAAYDDMQPTATMADTAVDITAPLVVRPLAPTSPTSKLNPRITSRPDHELSRRQGLLGRRPLPAAVASIAAVLLVMVAAAGVLTRGGGETSGDQALSAPTDVDATNESAAVAAAGAGMPLGEVADVGDLVAKVTGNGGPLARASSGTESADTGSASATASASNSGNTGDAMATAESQPRSPAPPDRGGIQQRGPADSSANSGAHSEAAATAGSSAGGSNIDPLASPNPCEAEVRGDHVAAGDLVYQAVASYRGAETIVFGFQVPGSGGPLTLVMVAREGCRPLLDAVVP